MVRIAITGHRSNKLGGYDVAAPLNVAVYKEVKHHLLKYKDNNPKIMGLTGMALGADQIFARVCVDYSIPFIAAVPFEGQESVWPKESQDYYHWLLDRAKEVVVVSAGGYEAKKMQRRNEYLVDNCNVLIAVFDGTSGGTANCVRYAKDVGRKIIRIDPRNL